jgi:DNA-binding response OmpR family regulator
MDAKMKILVVDDEKEICEFMEMILRARGYEVLTALSGKDAIAAVKEKSPQVIIVDKRMPEMDGIQTLHSIREIDKATKVFMLSGDELDANTESVLKELGAIGYLHKPITISELNTALKSVSA